MGEHQIDDTAQNTVQNRRSMESPRRPQRIDPGNQGVEPTPIQPFQRKGKRHFARLLRRENLRQSQAVCVQGCVHHLLQPVHDHLFPVALQAFLRQRLPGQRRQCTGILALRPRPAFKNRMQGPARRRAAGKAMRTALQWREHATRPAWAVIMVGHRVRRAPP